MDSPLLGFRMIEVGFLHTWVPRASAVLSYLFNPLFIYLVIYKTRSPIGSYKYILISFAVFDLVYTTVELLCGMGTHGHEGAFVVFVSHGFFYENLHAGLIMLSIRCGFISLSYGILAIHFIYRYVALCRPDKLPIFTETKYVVGFFVFFLLHGVVWSGVCYFLLYGDEEMRSYMDEAFIEAYNVSALDVPMLGSIFWDVSGPLCFRGWLGILILTGVSCYAITFYGILGYKIHRQLDNNSISKKAINMHRQLLKALVIQTVIPMAISYCPCIVAWYTPLVGLSVGKYNNYYTIIFLSFFPFCDPIAVIFFLPDYRRAVLQMFGIKSATSRENFHLGTQNSPKYKSSHTSSFTVS